MLYTDHIKAYLNAPLPFASFPSLVHSQHHRKLSLPKPRQSIKLPWLRHAILNPTLLGFNDFGQIKEHIFRTMFNPSRHHADLLSLASNPVLERARQSPTL